MSRFSALSTLTANICSGIMILYELRKFPHKHKTGVPLPAGRLCFFPLAICDAGRRPLAARLLSRTHAVRATVGAGVASIGRTCTVIAWRRGHNRAASLPPPPRVAAAAVATRAPLCRIPFPRLGSSSSNWFFFKRPAKKGGFHKSRNPKPNFPPKGFALRTHRAKEKSEARPPRPRLYGKLRLLLGNPLFAAVADFPVCGALPRPRENHVGQGWKTVASRGLKSRCVPSADGRRLFKARKAQGSSRARRSLLPPSCAKKRRFCLRPAPRGRAPPAGSRLPHAFAACGARAARRFSPKRPSGGNEGNRANPLLSLAKALI